MWTTWYQQLLWCVRGFSDCSLWPLCYNIIELTLHLTLQRAVCILCSIVDVLQLSVLNVGLLFTGCSTMCKVDDHYHLLHPTTTRRWISWEHITYGTYSVMLCHVQETQAHTIYKRIMHGHIYFTSNRLSRHIYCKFPPNNVEIFYDNDVVYAEKFKWERLMGEWKLMCQ